MTEELDNATPAPAENVAPGESTTPPQNEIPVENTPPADAPPADASLTDWRKDLPEDLRDHPSMAKFKNPEDGLKAYVELEKAYGAKQKGVDLPTDWEDAEQVEAFYSKLRPEDGYSTVTEALPEESREAYNEIFAETGLTSKQAQNLVEKVSKIGNDQLAAERDADAMIEILKADHGEGYEKVLESTSALIIENLSPEDRVLFEGSTNENVGLFHRLAKSIQESYGIKEGNTLGSPTGSGELSGEAKKARLAEIDVEIRKLGKNPSHTIADKNNLIAEKLKLLNLPKGK